MYQTSTVECGQHVDIARICLFTLINNNYVEPHEVATFPGNFGWIWAISRVQKNAKKMLCHRALGTGVLFLSLIVLQISYIASFCISGDLTWLLGKDLAYCSSSVLGIDTITFENTQSQHNRERCFSIILFGKGQALLGNWEGAHQWPPL